MKSGGNGFGFVIHKSFFLFFFFINDRPYSLEVQRALRQGDILSSLLFILVMELFSIMLHKNVGVGYLTGF